MTTQYFWTVRNAADNTHFVQIEIQMQHGETGDDCLNWSNALKAELNAAAKLEYATNQVGKASI